MQSPIEVHIEVTPNAIGIDWVHLALTESVRQRLLQLCTVMQADSLLSVKVGDLPLRWYQSGELQPAPNQSICELVGSASHQDLTLHVEARFPGEPNQQGMFASSCYVHGEWFFGVLAELNEDRLREVADENGDILATCDHDDRSQYVAKPVICPRPATWPNPFTHLAKPNTQTIAAHQLLPATYEKTPRSLVADAVLTALLKVASDNELNPDSRCVLYTLAASLYLCPDEVQLMRDISDVPPFLRLSSSRDAGEVPLTDADLKAVQRMCGTCNAEFSPPPKTLHIRYQHLVGRLVLGGDPAAMRWSASHSADSLAIWYEDHANNQFAWQTLRKFLPQYSDDHCRLKILAFGIDALARRLSPETPWREDLRGWLEDEESYF